MDGSFDADEEIGDGRGRRSRGRSGPQDFNEVVIIVSAEGPRGPFLPAHLLENSGEKKKTITDKC